MSDEYKEIVDKEIKESIFLSALSSTSWKTIDLKLRNIIHYIRLYISFTDETSKTIYIWKDHTLDQVNNIIFIRNSELVMSNPSPFTIAQLEHSDLHGPLGKLLYLAKIQDSVLRAFNKAGKFNIRCDQCSQKLTTFFMSAECDMHAPWICPSCSNVAIEIQRQSNKS